MQQSFLLRMAWEGFLVRMFRNLSNNTGCDILSEDWDNLLILDACRYDYFRALNFIDGRLEKRISRASETVEWIKKNFSRECSDIVYVTANPRSQETDECLDNFHAVMDLSEKRWNEEFRTVLPQAVVDGVKIAKIKYPDKRIIAHFIQPHHPFITNPELYELDLGISWEHKEFKPETLWEKFVMEFSGVFPPLETYLRKRKRATKNIWTRAEAGEVDSAKLKIAYANNLVYVLKEIQDFAKSLDGRTIISADHGNLFGEYFIYKHPPSVRLEKLVEVPWFIVGGR